MNYVEELEAENRALRSELRVQWAEAHANYYEAGECGAPCHGREANCAWPLPQLLVTGPRHVQISPTSTVSPVPVGDQVPERQPPGSTGG